RLPEMNASGELMDRKIWPLPRTVNGKIAQRHRPYLVKMRVGRTKKLARNFRGRVRTQRLGEMLFFRKRNPFRCAVNRRTRCEDEALDSPVPGGFEQMQRPRDIGLIIKLRALDRRSNAGTSGKMKDGIERLLSEDICNLLTIAKIDVMDANVLCDTGNVRAFDLRIVKVVKIIEDGDLMAICEQPSNQMRTNEAGAASHENVHWS